MPVRHLRKHSEPRTCYHFQSHATMRALLDGLRWPEARASIAYQSRLGQDQWLEPYTDNELERLARCGVRRLAVICPSFIVDCLETLEEIAQRGVLI
jgi:protoporphyrin/coproporphyrin ferrochelatase